VGRGENNNDVPKKIAMITYNTIYRLNNWILKCWWKLNDLPGPRTAIT
jgi:hypothetical protein